MATVTISQPGSVTDYGLMTFVGGRYFVTFVIGGVNKLYVLDEPTAAWVFVDTSAVLATTGTYEIFYAGNGWWVVQDANLAWAKSNNLTSWTAISRPGGTTSQIFDLAGNDEGTMWIATGSQTGKVAGTDSGYYWTSTDLSTWTEQTLDTTWFYVNSVAFVNDKWHLTIKTHPDPATNLIVSSATGVGGVGGWTTDHTETTVPTGWGYGFQKGAPDSDALYFIGSGADEGSWMRYNVATHAWVAVVAAATASTATLGPNGAPVIIPDDWSFDPLNVYDPGTNTWGAEATGITSGEAYDVYDYAMGQAGLQLLLFSGGVYSSKLLRFGGAYSAIPRDKALATEEPILPPLHIRTTVPALETFDWAYGSYGERQFASFERTDGGTTYPLRYLDETTKTWVSAGCNTVNSLAARIRSIHYAGGRWFVRWWDDLTHWYWSTDLTTWTQFAEPVGAISIYNIAGNDEGTAWVVAGKANGATYGSTPASVWTSPDLVTWTEVSLGVTWRYSADVAYFDEKWFVILPETAGSGLVRAVRGATAALPSSPGDWTSEALSASSASAADDFHFRQSDHSLYFWGAVSTGTGRYRRDIETNAWTAVAAAPIDGGWVASLGPNGALVEWDTDWLFEPARVHDPQANTWSSVATGVDPLADIYDVANMRSGLLLADNTAGTVEIIHYQTAYTDTLRETGSSDDYLMDDPPLLVGEAVVPEDLDPYVNGGLAEVEAIATASELVLFYRYELIEVEATGDETVTEEWLHLVQDAGTADDLMTPSTASTNMVIEDGEASESTTLFFTAELVDETLPTTEELTPESAVWLIETGAADDLSTLSVVALVTDSAAASEDLTAYYEETTEDSFGTATEEAWGAVEEVLTDETATASEVLTGYTASFITDSGAASDVLTAHYEETIEDSFGTATDELWQEFGVTLTDATSTADEVLTDSSTRSITLTDETAVATDAATPALGQDVNDETVTAIETLTPTFVATLVDETITVGEDLIEGGAPTVDTLVDTATADDLMTASVASLAEIIEVATATDALLAKDAGAVAWVLNPDTTAAYWYSNFQFTDIVQVDGVVLGVGPDGLCILTGSTDNGDAIDAAVTTGLMDFGTEQKKRVKEFRYGYTSDGKMNLTIEVDGQSRGWRYPLPKNLDGLPRNGRVLPGQGLNSRYWRLTLENSAGSGFDVKSGLADIITHTRRL